MSGWKSYMYDWQKLWTLAWPIVLSRATQAVVGFSDALMVTPLGGAQLAAVTTGAVDVLTLVMLPMGTVFILQSFAAQLRGRGDLGSAARYVWYGLTIAFLAQILAFLIIPLLPGAVALLGYEPEVERSMVEYICIRLFSIGAIVGIEALNNWYGGLGNTRIALWVGSLVMLVNVGLNYALIEPRFGLPGYGVAGAAWASTSATLVGLATVIAFWHFRVGHSLPRVRLSFVSSEFASVLRFGLPSGLNYFLEFAAFALFINWVVGSLGTTVLSAFNIVLQWSSIAFMPAFGLASAGAILVGETIGKGRPEAVPRWVLLTLILATAWMLCVGALYLAFPGFFFGFFASDDESSQELLRVGTIMLGLSGLWQVFDATAMVMSEALRAAGDTLWPMLVRLLFAWGLFFPLSWYVVRGLGGGPRSVMFSVVLYIVAVAGALVFRFYRGAWRSTALLSHAEAS